MNYDIVSEEYDERYYTDDNEDNRKIQSILIELLSTHNINKVLDIGCGTGYWINILLNSGHEYSSILGIDSSIGMIKKAKLKFTPYRNVKLIEGDFSEFNHIENYDLVMTNFFWSIASLHLDFLDEIKKIYALMSAKGVFLVVDNKIPNKIKIHEETKHKIILNEKWSNQVLKMEYVLYDQFFLERTMRKIGFNILSNINISNDIYLIVGEKP